MARFSIVPSFLPPGRAAQWVPALPSVGRDDEREGQAANRQRRATGGKALPDRTISSLFRNQIDSHRIQPRTRQENANNMLTLAEVFRISRTERPLAGLVQSGPGRGSSGPKI